MPKLNVEAFADQIDDRIEHWIDKLARPHLLYLLNKAQAKVKRRLEFTQGMGRAFFSLNDSPSIKLNDALYGIGSARRIELIAARFPELMEFVRIVGQIQDRLDREVGDILPTVRAKGVTRV